MLPNTVNAYNQSGAVNLTPLTLAFPSRTTVTQVTTYDITGPGPGGQGGTQFVCPTPTAVQSGQTVTIIPASVGGASIIDIKNYFVALSAAPRR